MNTKQKQSIEVKKSWINPLAFNIYSEEVT